jgi:hypothetical protein
VPTTPRWELDPYVLYHADMAQRQGVLVGRLSSVQQALVASLAIREARSAEAERTTNFEERLFIHQPETYERYLEQKRNKAEDEDVGVEWRTPQTMEDAMAVAAEFAELEAQARASGALPGLELEAETDGWGDWLPVEEMRD